MIRGFIICRLNWNEEKVSYIVGKKEKKRKIKKM